MVRQREKKDGCLMTMTELVLGNPSDIHAPHFWHWLKRSKLASLAWTAMRVWLGVVWLQAGISKLWGVENPSFLHHNGAGVAGFAAHGVAAYSWWGSFLHSFVVPNSGWIAVLVAVAEFAIGACLALGFLTSIAAFGSLILLFTYVMSGTASVCAFYALFAIIILTMWRTSGWIGVDGLIIGRHQRHMRERAFDANSNSSDVGNMSKDPGEVMGVTDSETIPVVVTSRT
jgi:thiosulfate dehydrogenase [quinone] large subunit